MSDLIEKWKDIPDYPNYQVSTFGRVKSFKRGIGYNERILKHSPSDHYPRVGLSNRHGKRVKMRVHQLMAMAFLGHKPNGFKLVVDHIDHNPQNNTLSNLQIITNRENCTKDKTNKTSKYSGVWFRKNRNAWIAEISIDGNKKSLGYFKDELEAAQAYQNELKKLEI